MPAANQRENFVMTLLPCCCPWHGGGRLAATPSAIHYDAQPVEPPIRKPIVSSSQWVSVATYSDRISAQAVLGLLSGQGLPAYIKSDEFVPGLGSNFSVFVPADQARQAQRLLEQGHVSEKELTELATGTGTRSPED
jgi:hypothetical protein